MPHNLALRRFYYDDFQPLRLRGRAADTKRLYLTTLNNFERFLGRAAVLADLNDETVSRFLDWFLRQPPRGRSPYSANKERSNLLAIWRFACRRKRSDGTPLVSEWPNVEPEVEPVDPPTAWLDHELQRLFKTLQKLTGAICGIPKRHWWFALHCVLWDTGERISAVMELRWADVDFAKRFVVVRAATRKGGKTGRLYRLHPESVAALEAVNVRSAEAKVFPWPYTPNYLWNRYQKILEKAGLPTDCKRKFHCVRRSFASHAEALGLNATELLGHSSRKVTLAYLDRRIVEQKHAADVLFRPYRSAH